MSQDLGQSIPFDSSTYGRERRTRKWHLGKEPNFSDTTSLWSFIESNPYCVRQS